ncbi:hypothetical protein K488DRAFT_71806 [Vararia minispora EC-137]|uniref:Uncharacterized protein n=1 Tax=Vararia minispora EC-137 TaxID=1314806 RepID=A0ACB8QGG8_9AGAM|nr:hypothetical protein K488DRAFT_71806 [Vararia minispora EC-137]
MSTHRPALPFHAIMTGLLKLSHVYEHVKLSFVAQPSICGVHIVSTLSKQISRTIDPSPLMSRFPPSPVPRDLLNTEASYVVFLDESNQAACERADAALDPEHKIFRYGLLDYSYLTFRTVANYVGLGYNILFCEFLMGTYPRWRRVPAVVYAKRSFSPYRNEWVVRDKTPDDKEKLKRFEELVGIAGVKAQWICRETGVCRVPFSSRPSPLA